MNHILFYGAVWCSDCKRSKDYLDFRNISYEYIDIDMDKNAADKVAEINNGYKSVPTIILADGRILVEPTNAQLQAAID